MNEPSRFLQAIRYGTPLTNAGRGVWAIRDLLELVAAAQAQIRELTADKFGHELASERVEFTATVRGQQLSVRAALLVEGPGDCRVNVKFDFPSPLWSHS